MRDVLRVLGLWRGRALWLAAGVVVSLGALAASRGSSDSAIPTPVSATQNSIWPRGSPRAPIVIRPPSGVNLIAFDSRFVKICCTLV